jgi:5-methyltetrahydropteroyltriglutamate--homocysteine methyltransferase
MELLEALRAHGYPNEIGPGVYDIHSPRVPSAEEMGELLGLALEVLRPEQIWGNPAAASRPGGGRRPRWRLRTCARRRVIFGPEFD